MEHLTQTTILFARTLQGISPIFVEYSLWIAIFSIVLFAIGELITHITPYKDDRRSWIAQAFGVTLDNVSPVPSAYVLACETNDPHTRVRNPFHIQNWTPQSHQSDYIVRSDRGTAFVSVYNWRGSRARNTGEPGVIDIMETIKHKFFSGYRRSRIRISPDQDTKMKSATLNLHLLSRFGSDAKISSICLHKNRNPSLVLRTTSRDIHGRMAAHIDIEQIRAGRLPTGNGGQIDHECWQDLNRFMKSQPTRMMKPSSTIARIVTVFALLLVFHSTGASTIDADVIKELVNQGSQIMHIDTRDQGPTTDIEN